MGWNRRRHSLVFHGIGIRYGSNLCCGGDHDDRNWWTSLGGVDICPPGDRPDLSGRHDQFRQWEWSFELYDHGRSCRTN